MTDQQKLSKAIQDEIHRCDMRELALNSLRFNTWVRNGNPSLGIEERLDRQIIASIPDDAELRDKPFTH